MEFWENGDCIYAIGQYSKSAELVYVKFGVTTYENHKARIAQLRTANPLKLKYIALVQISSREAAFKLERVIHESLESHRLQGEWFNNHPYTLQIVNALYAFGPTYRGASDV